LVIGDGDGDATKLREGVVGVAILIWDLFQRMAILIWDFF
jgi:hypothetical protein